MLAIQGVYNGTMIIPKEKIPFRDEYEVVITFIKPKDKEKIEPFVSESEMIDYINDIGEQFYGN